MGPATASVQMETNGSNLSLRWKVIDSLSAETSAVWIRLKPMVLAAANLELLYSFQAKSTSSAFKGCPSDHTRFGRSLKVKVFRSAETPPLAIVGTSTANPG